ncbi:MAG: hypothetical protein ABSA93_23760 [Streptosporangiaceae bacterium]
MTLLDITVDTGEFGPVVSLSGECDLSTAGQLSAALTAQRAVRELRSVLSGCDQMDLWRYGRSAGLAVLG